MKKLVLFLLVAVGTYAQSTINGNRTFLGSVNATTATETQPFKAGVLADRPATCSIADTYFATDGTAGSNIYICTSANTWTQISAVGGSGTVTSVSVTSVPNWLTASFANQTTTPALTISATTGQTSHEVIGTCGTNTSFGPCALTVGDLPTGYLYSSLSGAPTLHYQTIQKGGTAQTQRDALNLIAGSNITISCADNAGSDSTDCTFTSSATGWTVGTLGAMPTTCSVGAGYFATDQPANQQLYTCSAVNTWTQSMSVGPSGALSVTAGALDVTSIVPEKGAPNTFTALNTFQAGLNLDTTNTRPTCSSSTRGYLWFLDGGASADAFDICEYNGSAYAWTSGGEGGSGITALTGDVTASGSGSVTATLATVNSAPGACGDATHVCQVTTNGKGLVTAQTAVAISGAGAATSLVDSNGKSVITTSAATSPVNYLTAGNSATGSPVTLTAAGTDTNISIDLIPKGTGTVECNGTSCGGFTGTAGSVPFVGSGVSLTQDNANFFWDDMRHVLSLGTNNNSVLNNYMDTGIELYANGNNYGRGGLVLTGPAGGAYAFSNSSFNSNFCFSSNNFASCLIAVNPSISSSNLYFDSPSSTGANAAFSILAGSEGGHIYTHGTAPGISGTNCYPGYILSDANSTVTSGSTSVTVPSASDNLIAVGEVVVDTGNGSGYIPAGTTVAAVSGTTVTLSQAATGTTSTDTVSFVIPSTNNDINGSIAFTGISTACTITFATAWSKGLPMPTTSNNVDFVSRSSTAVVFSTGNTIPATGFYHMAGTD